MANFTTHLAIGTVVSGGLATLTLAANMIPPETLVAFTLAGVVGSVLPDIDLKDSRPSRALFAGLAMFFSFVVLFGLAMRLSVVEMLAAWLGTLVTVRYGGEALFHRLSYHRGIFHSILAGATAWFLTTLIFHRIFGYDAGLSWLGGAFVFAGVITHLVLDELYSIDVEDRRIKTSFGSALKLFDYGHLGQSGAMAAVCAAAFVLTPPADTFVAGLTSRTVWESLHARLLPHGTLFGVDTSQIAARVGAGRTADPITTGALPTTAPAAADQTGGAKPQ